MTPRLKEKYINEVIPALNKQFNFKNVMQVPKVDKVVINMGVGIAGQTGGDPKALDRAIEDMQIITGQKPVVTRSRKSVANFKLREGARVGCKVTLRGPIMYEFLDRLFMRLFRESETLAESIRIRSTDAATSRWALKSSLSSLKSSTIKSTRFAVWM
jgi:ribosomal protein L5